jgi:hypothetical protein
MSRTETDSRARTDEVVTTSDAPAQRVEVVERRRQWAPAFGPQQVLAALGGLAVVVAGFLEWVSSGAGFLTGAEARQIPFEFLWDLTPSGSPSLLIALIPIGLVAIASALWFGSIGLRILSGFAALVVVGVFAYELSETLGAVGDDAGGVFDHLGVGWYLALVGGLLTLIASSVPIGATRRSDEVPA